jgi:hypothetical protein
MRLILVGCEYAGKTTLANEIVEWIGRTMGSSRTFHDHFSIPNAELPEEDKEPYAALSPYLRQLFQLYMMNHHFHDTFYGKPDHNLIGFHIEEAIYGPLYYGYAADGDIGSPLARRLEGEIMQKAPDTVLILLRAQPEVIVRRMAEARHEWQIVQEKDVEFVLQRFEEEYEASILPGKFALDTSDVPVLETLAEFAVQIEPLINRADRQRIQAHQDSHGQ